MTLTAPGSLGNFTVAACLHQAHAPWMTETYVSLTVAGLNDENWMPIAGRTSIPASRAGEIGQVLCGLAARAAADQKEEVTAYLTSLRGEVNE